LNWFLILSKRGEKILQKVNSDMLFKTKKKGREGINYIYLPLSESNWEDQQWSPYQMMFGTKFCKLASRLNN
jgi:hypothetical protein